MFAYSIVNELTRGIDSKMMYLRVRSVDWQRSCKHFGRRSGSQSPLDTGQVKLVLAEKPSLGQ